MSNLLKDLSQATADLTARASAGLYHLGGEGIRGRTAVGLDGEHVVTLALQAEEGEKVSLLDLDGQEIEATVRGFDGATGLVVLKLPEGTKTSTLASAAAGLRVGSWALTVAYPSPEGVEARLEILRCIGRDGAYLQTDGLPYPGFAGAVTLSPEGEFIGLVAENGPGNSGWILPAREVLRITEFLKTKGSSLRPWVGLYLEALELDSDSRAKAGQDRGLWVRGVESDSPAQKADLRQGDILLSVGGTVLGHPQEFLRVLEKVGVDAPLEVRGLRSGSPFEATLRTGGKASSFRSRRS